MAFKKGQGGRKKGAPNKMTAAAREVIEGCAMALGGQRRMVEWAKEDPLNERIFWGTIYPKMLPLQVNATVDTRITVNDDIPAK